MGDDQMPLVILAGLVSLFILAALLYASARVEDHGESPDDWNDIANFDD